MTSGKIHLTDSAIEAFQQKLEERKTPKSYIRLGIRGAGCSGFSYAILFEDNPPRDKDIQFFFNGIRVLVDIKSMTYLNGCTLHWEKTLVAQGFKFDNPNVKSTCGCGSSFTLKENK